MCVCVGDTVVLTVYALCVCVCAAHFYLFISFAERRKPDDSFLIFAQLSAANVTAAAAAHASCSHTRTHTHNRHAHTYRQISPHIRLFVKLTEKRHRRYRCHPIRCMPRAPPFPLMLPSCRLISRLCADEEEAQTTTNTPSPQKQSACFPFPCVFQFRSLLLPVTSVCSQFRSLSLTLSHYSTHSLSALQTAPSAAANCVCFIDFHSPTSFHSFLTILPLVASLALRGVNKNCNRFFFFVFL